MVPLIKVCLKSELEARTHLFFNQVYSTRQVTLFKNKKDSLCISFFVHVPYIRTSACAFNVLNNTFISEKFLLIQICWSVNGQSVCL